MNIVITGASKGIGFDTALAVAADKNNTVIALSRSEAGLNTLKKAAGEQGLHIDTYAADITAINDDGLQSIFSNYGVIDVLIN